MKKWFSLALLLLAAGTQAQTVVSLSPVAKQQFFSATGVPLATGCVNTYITGTSTPLATYTDSTGATPNPNPIILDAGGFANVWLSNASYRFVVVAYDGIPGNKCAAGMTQYTIDGINAFASVANATNLFLAGNTSDPSGTAGEMTYRTDIPCFRFFTTFWDCVVRLTDTQTLTNKTFASPILTGTTTGLVTTNANLTTPSINGITVTGPPATYLTLTNDITTGTTVNTLTKMLGATAVIAATTDTGGIVGITVSGAGKAGIATIQQNGPVSQCVFDGATTAGNYVQISSTVAGNCHDAGVNYPSNGQVIGRSQVTNGVAGTNAIVLFGPEIKPVPQTVAVANLTAQSANVTSTAMFTPAANGFYRFSCYAVVTQAATSSSTLPNCQVLWTDADTGTVEPAVSVTQSVSTNTVGTFGVTSGSAFYGVLSIFAKSGASISYATSGYASSGATPMQYSVHIRLEGPL